MTFVSRILPGCGEAPPGLMQFARVFVQMLPDRTERCESKHPAFGD